MNRSPKIEIPFCQLLTEHSFGASAERQMVGLAQLGLRYFGSFLSVGEQDSVMKTAAAAPWESLGRRQVSQYGFQYSIGDKQLTPSVNGELPGWSAFILDKARPLEGAIARTNQLIINKYSPGEGISPHIDRPDLFGERIYIISLGSPIVMNFKATDGSKSRFSILLEPGSLAILEGELRYKWKHSIDRRHIDNIAGVSLKREERISLTFREALPAACSNLQTLC